MLEEERLKGFHFVPEEDETDQEEDEEEILRLEEATRKGMEEIVMKEGARTALGQAKKGLRDAMTALDQKRVEVQKKLGEGYPAPEREQRELEEDRTALDNFLRDPPEGGKKLAEAKKGLIDAIVISGKKQAEGRKELDAARVDLNKYLEKRQGKQ